MDFDANSYSTRHMFERYLYDYLLKKNMHQTAETFMNEAKLEFNPNDPPAIDEPEGFLHEWWISNYDTKYFRQWVQMNASGGMAEEFPTSENVANAIGQEIVEDNEFNEVIDPHAENSLKSVREVGQDDMDQKESSTNVNHLLPLRKVNIDVYEGVDQSLPASNNVKNLSETNHEMESNQEA